MKEILAVCLVIVAARLTASACWRIFDTIAPRTPWEQLTENYDRERW